MTNYLVHKNSTSSRQKLKLYVYMMVYIHKYGIQCRSWDGPKPGDGAARRGANNNIVHKTDLSQVPHIKQ